MIYNDFVQSIGNTPLIKLRGPSEETQCNILGKAEYLNPGGSIKDRAAWAIIKNAEQKKEISKNFFPKDLLKLMEENSSFYFW